MEVSIAIPKVVENCAHCKRLISTFLGRTKGVFSYAIDMRAKQIKIFFAPDLTNVAHLRYAIANAGFQADTVQPEPTSVKLLPVCCRQPISEEWVSKIKAKERERAKAKGIRYRPLRHFLCCERCDYYYKYAILKDSSLPRRLSLKKRR